MHFRNWRSTFRKYWNSMELRPKRYWPFFFEEHFLSILTLRPQNQPNRWISAGETASQIVLEIILFDASKYFSLSKNCALWVSVSSLFFQYPNVSLSNLPDELKRTSFDSSYYFDARYVSWLKHVHRYLVNYIWKAYRHNGVRNLEQTSADLPWSI